MQEPVILRENGENNHKIPLSGGDRRAHVVLWGRDDTDLYRVTVTVDGDPMYSVEADATFFASAAPRRERFVRTVVSLLAQSTDMTVQTSLATLESALNETGRTDSGRSSCGR